MQVTQEIPKCGAMRGRANWASNHGPVQSKALRLSHVLRKTHAKFEPRILWLSGALQRNRRNRFLRKIIHGSFSSPVYLNCAPSNLTIAFSEEAK